MSNCTITVTVDGKEIVLDPGSDVTPDNLTPLANNIPSDKLRSLYSTLKNTQIFDALVKNNDTDTVTAGRQLYKEARDQAVSDGKILTTLGAIMKETDPEKIKSLVAYASSLDAKRVLTHGNYALQPELAYMASPYSTDYIKRLVYSNNSAKQKMFENLLKVPGMENVKMSIAYADEWKGQPLESVKGVYISPDNIIQLVIPSRKDGFQTIYNTPNNMVTSESLMSTGKSQAQDTLLHEMMHAVFSEMYFSNPEFKSAIDEIHDKFMKSSQGNKAMYDAYADVHEFIASVFEDPRMQMALSRIKTKTGPIMSDAFSDFASLVDPKLLEGDGSLIKDYIGLVGRSLESLNTPSPITVVDNSNKQTSFFDDGDDHPLEQEEYMSPNDATDNYSANNRKAWYAFQRFQKRYKDDSFVRDSFYKSTVLNPTTEQIDTLRSDDVIIVPWLEYKPATYKDNKQVTPSQWVEMAMVTKKKDGEPMLDANKKPIVEPMVRGEDGQPARSTKVKGGYLKEASQAFPVMYSNIKKGQVVVAKTTLTNADEFKTKTANGKAIFNTFSLPYNLVRGIKKLDNEYFNHKEDYDTQLKEAQLKLTTLQKANPTQSNFNDLNFFTARVEQLTANVKKAQNIREQMKNLTDQYGFSREQDGKRVLNIPEADYAASNYDKSDMSRFIFPQDPMYRLHDLGAGKYVVTPNANKFDIYWDGDKGKEFAKSSEAMSEAVSAGDLVRLNTPHTFTGPNGEKVSFAAGQWMVVNRRVGNGVEAATADGEGYIVPFNSIEAYAKNKSTDEYRDMMSAYTMQVATFNATAYVPGTKRLDPKVASAKSLVFDADRNTRQDEDAEVAVQRFSDNLNIAKNQIKPGESFVRLQRADKYDYALVVAKTPDALIVFTDTVEGGAKLETIDYDSTVAKRGVAITHVIENQSKVAKVWQKFINQKATFEENKKSANFKFDNNAWSVLQEARLNPQKITDAYDFYDDVNGANLAKITEGTMIGIYYDKSKLTEDEISKLTSDYYYRPAVRVADNGRVIVASFRTDSKDLGGGFILPGGQAYGTYVSADRIAKIGYNITDFAPDPKTKETSSKLNAELLQRRKNLWQISKRDRDFDAYSFTPAANAQNFNDKYGYSTTRDYDRYIPLTNVVAYLDANGNKPAEGVPYKYEGEPYYLDQNMQRTTQDKAAWVKAKFKQGTQDLSFVYRGLLSQSELLNKKVATSIDANGNTVVKQQVLDAIRPGDWVTTINKDGSYWDSLIERVSGGQIYTLNDDMTTTKVKPESIFALRFSKRNESASGWTRYKNLYNALTTSKAVVDANQQAQTRANAKAQGNENTNNAPFSLDADYKSPAASRRAIYEVGKRLSTLNPDVKINYAEQEDISNLVAQTGFDYNQARAFVLNGEVYINMKKASVSDVVHEYAHLFLHSLKVENPRLYSSIIGVALGHPMYAKVAATYSHLGGDDLNEEAFVTILGEYMQGKMKPSDANDMNDNRKVIMGFADYTKSKLTDALGRGKSIHELDPKEVLNMSLEDVINMVGDEVMNNRITDMTKAYDITRNLNVDKFKKELYDKGLLTQECYG